MSEPTYRIRPLVWDEDVFGYPPTDVIATCLTGTYVVRGGTHVVEAWGPDGFGRFLCDDTATSLRIEAAKSSAEAHYRERLSQALEVVEC